MANEEFDRKMEFIVEQHAQFAAKLGQLEDIVARLANASLSRFERTDEKIDALIESQAKTDENLRNLIAVVDRHFASQNGKSEN